MYLKSCHIFIKVVTCALFIFTITSTMHYNVCRILNAMLIEFNTEGYWSSKNSSSQGRKKVMENWECSYLWKWYNCWKKNKLHNFWIHGILCNSQQNIGLIWITMWKTLHTRIIYKRSRDSMCLGWHCGLSKESKSQREQSVGMIHTSSALTFTSSLMYKLFTFFRCDRASLFFLFTKYFYYLYL